MRRFVFIIFLLSVVSILQAQEGRVRGQVNLEGQAGAYVTLSIPGTGLGAISDEKGRYVIEQLPTGIYLLKADYLGFESSEQTFRLTSSSPEVLLDFDLKESPFSLNELVVTGTKTFKRQVDSPVIVNVLNAKTLDNVQACNLSDGLRFQPGLRVETDCQTCNYTQLRMNGLAGGYSQILINGRPIFSPLTGLYGLEQLPVNMIERIEVVRGGGSTLYGSSAIGGTVNVITRLPKTDSYEASYTYSNINARTDDHVITGNARLVSEEQDRGVSFFLNQRNRYFYDHNADNFSELPELRNTAIGMNAFILPHEDQKIEISLSRMNEYRLGGDMSGGDVEGLEQAEERFHEVWMASLDHHWNVNGDRSSVITYAAAQRTDRDHYTGILPDDAEELQVFLQNPPFGTSLAQTLQIGGQINHKVKTGFLGPNTLTLGGEYLIDEVRDDIPAYAFLVDQTTKDLGVFLQSDWQLRPSLNLLSGVRMDDHNLLDGLIFSPRASLLYKQGRFTQYRLNYATGFRAPQAFDTDLHIAFAGGGVSRVSLDPGLDAERSRSVSASVNYDRPMESYILGFTLEGFRTHLDRAFFLDPVGEDAFGERFVKRNGQGATVQGLTLELRANYKQKSQLEAGFTLQSSRFDEEVELIDGLPGTRYFARTPETYGFATLSIMPYQRWDANLNYVYTGSMVVPHFAGAPEQVQDELFRSPAFHEFSLKFSYRLKTAGEGPGLQLYGGVKNFTNSYQQDFDTGKNRDSNYIYGPAQPRTVFLGIKLNGQ
ncbi:MAG: TonB-dependent receptor [Bacteroidetes bacterium]|nr:TonB-dependent receptor [Bacteroidota bacterium]